MRRLVSFENAAECGGWRGLVERGELLRRFEQIEPDLYRYPAVDPGAFRKAVERIVADGAEST